jgi:hypothetical protein
VKGDALPLSLAPRGLCRETAAAYWSISPSKFDQLVLDGRAPKPKRIDNRKVWDRRELDLAFDALPAEGEGTAISGNPWDAR